jgi:hypothetical protein
VVPFPASLNLQVKTAPEQSLQAPPQKRERVGALPFPKEDILYLGW